MLQEKAQDRERLLLKFIKIMKVTACSVPRAPCLVEAAGTSSPALPHPSSPVPLFAAPAQAEQLQLLPGHPLSTGLSAHPQTGVAEADLRGRCWEVLAAGLDLSKTRHGSPSGHSPLCDPLQIPCLVSAVRSPRAFTVDWGGCQLSLVWALASPWPSPLPPQWLLWASAK